MSLRKLFLSAFALLLIPSGLVLAQQTPAAPELPDNFTFHFNGGSFLGIYTEEITRENMGRYNLREVRGVAISKVIEGSPAEKAGLKKDDVVVRFNGEDVTSVRKLNRLISEVAPDHAARVTISRSGGEQELSVTLAQRKDFTTAMTLPRMDGQSRKELENLFGNQGTFNLALGSSRRIGVSTTVLTKQLADYFGAAAGHGVLLTSVRDDSPAAKAGLKAGDIITEVDGEKIEDAGDLSRAINRKTEGEITLTIVRDKSQRTIRVTPEKGEGMQYFTPEMKIQGLPRIGQLNLPRIRVSPNFDKTALPRIQALPRVRELLGDRPL